MNFKSIQKLVERQKKLSLEEISKIKKDPSLSSREKLAIVKKLIKNLELYQKTLRSHIAKDAELRSRLVARKDNLEKLKQFLVVTPERVKDEDEGMDGSDKNNNDVLLDLHNPHLINWYRDESNLLIVDYLLKANRNESKNWGLTFLSSLAQNNPKVNKLIDFDVFNSYNTICISIIKYHDLTLLIEWYNENKSFLKKSNSNLEFEINYSKFLTLIHKGKVTEAIEFSRKNLSSFSNINNYDKDNLTNFENNVKVMKQMGGLMLYLSVDCVSEYSGKLLRHEYENLLSDERWDSLIQCFVTDFTKIYGTSANDSLKIYLSAGLASLKTKSCYCDYENTIFRPEEGFVKSALHESVLQDPKYRVPSQYYRILKKINNCPVCSPELNDIGRNLPYAQLITNIFNDPYLLPNGNIYSYDKLLSINNVTDEDALSRKGKIQDPLTKQVCLIEDCVRVYPA